MLIRKVSLGLRMQLYLIKIVLIGIMGLQIIKQLTLSKTQLHKQPQLLLQMVRQLPHQLSRQVQLL